MEGSKALPRLCLLGLLLCASSSIAASSVDFFFLNLIWPGTRCQLGFLWQKTCCVNKDVSPPARDFLVQGMETYDSVTGNPVANCTKKCTFLMNPLANLVDDLYTYWPTLTCPCPQGSDLKLKWQSAWCTYGNCSTLTQVDYFNRTLQLRKKVNLLTVLGSKGIIPSATATYNLEDIQDALVAKLGFSTVVECVRMYFVWPLVYEDRLDRIRVCVSSNGKYVIGCPVAVKSNCGDTVKFYPFTDDMLGHEDEVPVANPIKLPSDKDLVL